MARSTVDASDPADRHGIGALPMPMAYLRLFLRRFGRDDETAASILEGTGITPEDATHADPDARVQVWQQLRQVRNLSRVASTDWALEVGPSLQGAAHGALGIAIATAPDLARALDVLERFGPLRAPYFRIRRETTGPRHILSIDMLLELEPDLLRPLVETLLSSVQALVESALGAPMIAARFALPFPPPDYADRYDAALHAPRDFDAPRAAIAMPVAWLALACPFADATQHRVAVAALEGEERALEGPGSIVARVERVLESTAGAPPGADEVAARLHLSRRTLVRRLAERGARFRELADRQRRRRAEALLADERLSIAEVGERLGYTDPANFGRAVRRWFGVSPSTLRGK